MLGGRRHHRLVSESYEPDTADNDDEEEQQRDSAGVSDASLDSGNIRAARTSNFMGLAMRLRGAAGLIGGAIGRGAESVGEMMKDPVLRRKGAQALSKTLHTGMKQAQDGVASAAALTNKGASALRHALARIQARLREERIRAAIEESKEHPVDVQVAAQLFEDAPQEMRLRLWLALIEDKAFERLVFTEPEQRDAAEPGGEGGAGGAPGAAGPGEAKTGDAGDGGAPRSPANLLDVEGEWQKEPTLLDVAGEWQRDGGAGGSGGGDGAGAAEGAGGDDGAGTGLTPVGMRQAMERLASKGTTRTDMSRELGMELLLGAGTGLTPAKGAGISGTARTPETGARTPGDEASTSDGASVGDPPRTSDSHLDLGDLALNVLLGGAEGGGAHGRAAAGVGAGPGVDDSGDGWEVVGHDTGSVAKAFPALQALQEKSRLAGGDAGGRLLGAPRPMWTHHELLHRMAGVKLPPPEGTREGSTYSTLLQISIGLEDVDDAIERDLHRTFPEHPYFSATTGRQALFNVLKAYSVHDFEVGYCQGMAFCAGILLMYVPEEAAFHLLCQIMDAKGANMRALFLPGFEELKLTLARMDVLVAKRAPHVIQHLEDAGIPSVLYASQWLLTAFSNPFSPSFSARVLDVVLQERSCAMLLRTAAAVLLHAGDTLVTLRGLEAIMIELKEKPLHWTGDEQRAVLDLALSIDMSQDDMLGLDAQAEEEGRVKDWAK